MVGGESRESELVLKRETGNTKRRKGLQPQFICTFAPGLKLVLDALQKCGSDDSICKQGLG